TPSVDLTQRLVAAVQADRRTRLRFRRRVLATIALAASVLLAVVAIRSSQEETPLPEAGVSVVKTKPKETPKEPASEPSKNVVEETKVAALSLTSRLADKTIEQARLLWKAAPPLMVPSKGTAKEPPDPAGQTLREAGQSVSAGLEPMTSSARRAVGM